MNDSHQLSVSWNQYLKNVCNGLWSLQQHGEFVDMTLAADGHHVKVHKMLLSLASPYIKELITTADCAHPIIFLNQVSYTTLCLLLEYIYTGEVLVPREHFKSFMDAGQALHIKGLQMNDLPKSHFYENVTSSQHQPSPKKSIFTENRPRQSSVCSSNKSEEYLREDYFDTTDNYEDNFGQNHEDRDMAESNDDTKFESPQKKYEKTKDAKTSTTIQYSLSSHGQLQLVMNRYLYNVRYISRKTNQRKWQCIDGHCKGLKCPAVAVTTNDMLIRRSGVHNHPFHDKKILKKLHAGVIFTGVKEAEHQGKVVKENKEIKLEKKGKET